MKGKVVKQIKNCKITEVKEDLGVLYFVYSPWGDLMYVCMLYIDAQNWCLTNADYMSNPVTYERMKESAKIQFSKYDNRSIRTKAKENMPKYVYMVTVKKEPAYDDYDNGVEIAGVFTNENIANKARVAVETWLRNEEYDEAEVMVGRFEINKLEFYDLDKKII